MEKSRIPIKFAGLNQKFDDKQSIPGSFKDLTNNLFDKIGRIDRRYAYANLLVNDVLDSNLVTDHTRMIDRISRYENTLIGLVKNYNWANYMLVNPDTAFEADNLAVDIDIKPVESKSVYNPNLKQELNYSEQYQNLIYNERFNIQGLLSLEAKRGIHTFKLFRNDMEFFSFTSPAGGNTDEQYNAYNQMVSFELNNGTNRFVYFLYGIFNAAGDGGNGSTDFYLIEVKGSLLPQNDIKYTVTNYGKIQSIITGYTITDNNIQNLTQRAFSLVACGGSNTRQYVMLAHNDGPNTPKLSTWYIDTGALGTWTQADVIDVVNPATYVYDMALPVLKKIKTSLVDTACHIAFAGSFAGYAWTTEKSFRTIYTAIYEVSLSTGAITTTVAFDDQYTAPSVTVGLPNTASPGSTINTAVTQALINLEIAEDTTNGTIIGTYSRPRVFATFSQAYKYTDNVANEILQYSVVNKSNFIQVFELNQTTGALTSLTTIEGKNLASKIVTMNNSDYFVSTVCDTLQASYFLDGINRNGNKVKNISQFMYQNAGVVTNINLDLSLKKIKAVAPGGSFVAYGTLLKNINFGWTTNLNTNSNWLNYFTGNNNTEIPLWFGAAYRNNFSQKPQDFLSVDPTVSPVTSLVYYGQWDLSNYTDACSSRIVKFNLNSKTRFSNQNLYNTKYFTGGYLGSFNNRQLSHNGLHQYPEFACFQGTSPYRDIQGQLFNVSLTNTEYKGSYIKRGAGKWFYSGVTSGIDPAFDEIKINIQSFNDLKVGDKVRLVISALVPVMPTGIAVETNLVADFQYPNLVSQEYYINSISFVSGTQYAITLKDSSGMHVDFTTAGTYSTYAIVQSPYAVFDGDVFNFVAVYVYRDANGNLIRSAPSAPFSLNSKYNYGSGNTTFYTAYKLVLEVFNYNYADKQFGGLNPVSVELYRTIGNATTPNYYLCATASCDNTSHKVQLVTEYMTDDELLRGQQLYTNGGELESIPVPNPSCLAVKDNRLYAVNGENKSDIWYSKVLINGEGVEFNDALVKRINTADGKIVAICTMDEKMVVFKENSIHYFVGDGANATGAGEQFSDVQKISGNTGLDPNWANCFLLIDEGIVFKSTKGIYLLSRGLGEPIFIGAGIEDETRKATYFGNIIENKKRNEFKLAIDNKIWIFNREQKLWYSEDLSIKVLDLYSDISGIYAVTNPQQFLRISDSQPMVANQFLKQYEPMDPNLPALSSRADDLRAGLSPSVYDVSYGLKYYEEKLETNWILLNGIQNFARVSRLFLLGDLDTTWGVSFNIKITIDYDFGSGVTESRTYTNADFTKVGQYWQAEYHLANQKCQAIKITVESLNSNTNINNLKLSSMLFEVEPKRKLPLAAKRIK